MCLRPFAISKNQFMPLHVVKLDFATFEIFSCVYGSNLDVINFLRSHILAYAHAHSHNTLTPHTLMQLLVAPLGYTYLLVKGGHCSNVHPSEIFTYPHSHSWCSSLRGAIVQHWLDLCWEVYRSLEEISYSLGLISGVPKYH